MVGVRVQIVRFVDGAFPGFVERELVDAHGRVWSFVEKGPVVTADYLTARDSYPRPGVIACEVLGRTGRTVRIDTARPWCVESAEGETRFEVPQGAVIEWE
jgi:hypothetical protein